MLEKLSLRYCPTEDRLILSVQARGADGAVARQLALTRRVCIQWRHVLERMLELGREAPQPATRASAIPTATRALQGAGDDRAAPGTPATPSADTPIELVSTVSAGRRRIDGAWTLRFGLVSGGQLALRVSGTGAERLMQALQQQARTGNWALPSTAPSGAALGAPPKRALH